MAQMSTGGGQKGIPRGTFGTVTGQICRTAQVGDSHDASCIQKCQGWWWLVLLRLLPCCGIMARRLLLCLIITVVASDLQSFRKSKWIGALVKRTMKGLACARQRKWEGCNMRHFDIVDMWTWDFDCFRPILMALQKQKQNCPPLGFNRDLQVLVPIGLSKTELFVSVDLRRLQYSRLSQQFLHSSVTPIRNHHGTIQIPSISCAERVSESDSLHCSQWSVPNGGFEWWTKEKQDVYSCSR